MGIFDVPISDKETLYVDPIFEGIAIAFLTNSDVRSQFSEMSQDNTQIDGFKSSVKGLHADLDELSLQLANDPCAARYRNQDGTFKEEFIVKSGDEPRLGPNGQQLLDVAKVYKAESDRAEAYKEELSALDHSLSQSYYPQSGNVDNSYGEARSKYLKEELRTHKSNPALFGPVESSHSFFGGTKYNTKETIERGDVVGYELLKDRFIASFRGAEPGENDKGQTVYSSQGFTNGEDMPAVASALYTSVMVRIQGTSQLAASELYEVTEKDGRQSTGPGVKLADYGAKLDKVEGSGMETVSKTAYGGVGAVNYQARVPTEELDIARKSGRETIYQPNIPRIQEIRDEFKLRYEKYQGEMHAIANSDVGPNRQHDLRRMANKMFERDTARAHIELTKAEGRYNYDAKNPAINPSIGKGLITVGAFAVCVVPSVVVGAIGGPVGVGLAVDTAVGIAVYFAEDMIFAWFYTEDEMHSGEIKSKYMIPVADVHKGLVPFHSSADYKLQEGPLRKKYTAMGKEYDKQLAESDRLKAEYDTARLSGDESMNDLYDIALASKKVTYQMKGDYDALLEEINGLDALSDEQMAEFAKSTNPHAIYLHKVMGLDEEMQDEMRVIGLDKFFQANKDDLRDIDAEEAQENMEEIMEGDQKALSPIMNGRHILKGDELKHAGIEYLLTMHTCTGVDPVLAQSYFDQREDLEGAKVADTSFAKYLEPGSVFRYQNINGSWDFGLAGPDGSLLTQENAELAKQEKPIIDPLTPPEKYRIKAALERLESSEDPLVLKKARAIVIDAVAEDAGKEADQQAKESGNGAVIDSDKIDGYANKLAEDAGKEAPTTTEPVVDPSTLPTTEQPGLAK